MSSGGLRTTYLKGERVYFFDYSPGNRRDISAVMIHAKNMPANRSLGFNSFDAAYVAGEIGRPLQPVFSIER